MKDDLISRKTAIEEMLKCGEYYNGNDEAKRGVAQCIGVIHELPSAHPEKRAEERTETHACDSISRQAAIDALAKFVPYVIDDVSTESYTNGLTDAYNLICQLPSAQPEQQWIPWDSGKFPKESGTYTVTAYDGATKRVTYAKYQKRLKRWELTGARAYWRVLAWMPLPEPYKEDDHEG